MSEPSASSSGPGGERPEIPNLQVSKRKRQVLQAKDVQKPQVRKDKKQRESLLVAFLVQAFAWGHMPATKVQQIAHLAYQDLQKAKNDESIEEELLSMARCGQFGKHSGHVYGQLIEAVDTGVLPPAKPCPVPVKDNSQRGYGIRALKFVLPHELFASLYHNHKDKFRWCVCPGKDVLRSFWRSQQEHPQMDGHPIKEVENYQERAIPVSFHGDAVPVTGLSAFAFAINVELQFSLSSNL